MPSGGRKSGRRGGRAKGPGRGTGSPILRTLVPALLLAVLAVAPYLRALDYPFVYDDHRTVVDNPSIRSLDNVGAILHYERFRPLVNVSYALDYAAWELDPRGYRITNLALHAVAVVCLFVLVEGLGRDAGSPRPRLLAGVTAGVWGVHPVLTEAVVSVSGRSEVLSAALGLGAFVAMRRWSRRGGPSPLAAGLVLTVLAMAARETAAALPFLYLLADRLLGPGPPEATRRRTLRVHLPLVGVVVAAGTVRVGALLGAAELPRPVWQNLLTELQVVWRYLRLLVLPDRLSVVHPIERVSSPWDPTSLVAGAGLVGLVILAWRIRKRAPLDALGVAWFLLVIAPSSSIIPLAELMAEHRVYLAAAGVVLVTGDWLTRLLDRPSTAGPTAVAVLVVLGLLTAATASRIEVWRDPVTLWSDAAEKAPLTWAPHYALADALRDRGSCREAIPVYARAAELDPEHLGTLMNLGVCLAETGRHEDAAVVFRRAVAADPEFAPARNNLGRLAMLRGDAAAARRHFRRALEADPENVIARLNLASIAENLDRDWATAARLCREVRSLAPRTPGIDDCILRNEARPGGDA